MIVYYFRYHFETLQLHNASWSCIYQWDKPHKNSEDNCEEYWFWDHNYQNHSQQKNWRTVGVIEILHTLHVNILDFIWNFLSLPLLLYNVWSVMSHWCCKQNRLNLNQRIVYSLVSLFIFTLHLNFFNGVYTKQVKENYRAQQSQGKTVPRQNTKSSTQKVRSLSLSG